MLRYRQCGIIVLNAHAPIEDVSDVTRETFYDKFKQVFYHVRKEENHMKILLDEFNANFGREYVSKPNLG